mmetsp:Transcript_22524/g.43140  ORF Transcript_22524/g.43140 Transcript_22524/m.43140 type:complete len:90 (+) Transcript_22524:141-410(+)
MHGTFCPAVRSSRKQAAHGALFKSFSHGYAGTMLLGQSDFWPAHLKATRLNFSVVRMAYVMADFALLQPPWHRENASDVSEEPGCWDPS